MRPGQLSVGGNYTQSAGGTLQIEVDGTAAFDQLEVTGVATFAGTLAIVNGFTPAAGDTFQIVTSASRNGTFGTLTGAGPYAVDYPGGPSFGARLSVGGVPAPVAGTPQVSGTMLLGQTVTCNPGAWTNNPTFTFEWLRNGQPIATGATYVLSGADATTRSRAVSRAPTAAAAPPPPARRATSRRSLRRTRRRPRSAERRRSPATPASGPAARRRR